MASTSLLCLFSILLFLAAGAIARPGVQFHPCNTVFISYTFTSSDLPQIVEPRDYPSSSSGGYFTVYRNFRPLRPSSSSSTLALPTLRFRPMIAEDPRSAEMAQKEPSFGLSSLQLRAKDILFVVAGLLFGVVCGALIGAIMYLVWSLFTNQFELDRSSNSEDEDENPKKMGYIKIADQVHGKEGIDGH